MIFATPEPLYHMTFPGQLDSAWWTFVQNTVNTGAKATGLH